MRNKIMLIGIAFSLIAGPAMAAPGSPSKEEKIGLGTGATIGAIAGGPVGFIIGAAIGAKIGDEFYDRNENVDTLNGSLTGSKRKITEL